MGRAHLAHRADRRTGRADRAESVRDQVESRPQPVAASPGTTPLFRFVALEVPWTLGLPDGRYPLRPAAAAPPTHVVVIRGESPPSRRVLRRGRTAARRSAAEPADIRLSTATIIDVAAPLDPAAAEAWFGGAGEAEIGAGVDVLARVLHAYRLAAADPRAPELSRRQVLVARVGYGTGEELAAGRHTAARDIDFAESARPRRRMLAPDGRLAALLTGREAPFVCEELALRARRDLDLGRDRLAALGLLVALDAAVAELATEPGGDDLARRVEELRAERAPVTAAAQVALTGELDGDDQAVLARALGRLEAALRARAARRV